MGRGLILLLCAMATIVMVSAGAALAANVIGTNASENCGTLTPSPTNGADNITLAGGDDECNAKGGTDQVYGDSGADIIMGGTAKDELYGGGGNGNEVDGQGGSNDFVSVVDGDTDDAAAGGTGSGDTCAVDDQGEADNTCENILVAQ
jgi:RTX calcium-binding nonapeptide repeat (4 copies)